MKLQSNNNFDKNIERFVDVDCNITVNGNVKPISILDDYKTNAGVGAYPSLINKILKEHFGVNKPPKMDKRDLCVIETTCTLKYKDKEGWSKHKKYNEYTKYKDQTPTKMGRVIMVHNEVLNTLGGKAKELYCVDGMHRIMSAAENGNTEIGAYVIIKRTDISQYIKEETKEQIRKFGTESKWFPKYQEIREVGLDGGRKQEVRYRQIYDFTGLGNKTVADFGCNLGQAVLESVFNGANGYGFEYQKEVVNTGNEIQKALGINLTYTQIDFNSPTFQHEVNSVLPDGWEVLLFLAIYRTKEIKDISYVFDFLVSKTKEVIFFEGHGHSIDTQEYYNKIFAKYKFKEITYLGKSDHRPSWKILV